jgi:hypothetical protein
MLYTYPEIFNIRCRVEPRGLNQRIDETYRHRFPRIIFTYLTVYIGSTF